MRFSFPYLAPFFFGLFLAFIMDVPVSFLEARGWSRALSSLVFAVMFFLTLPAGVVLLLRQIWEEIQGLSFFSNLFSPSAQIYTERLVQLFEAIRALDTDLGLHTLLKWALAIPDLVLIWTITAVSAYFFCRDKWILARFFARQAPDPAVQPQTSLFRHLWIPMGLDQVQLLLMLISTAVSMAFSFFLSCPAHTCPALQWALVT